MNQPEPITVPPRGRIATRNLTGRDRERVLARYRQIWMRSRSREEREAILDQVEARCGPEALHPGARSLVEKRTYQPPEPEADARLLPRGRDGERSTPTGSYLTFLRARGLIG